MKKLLLFLLFFTGITNAQIVNIPDANFKAKLLSASASNYIASIYYDNVNFNNSPLSFNKLDINNDGQIQYSEVQNIQYLKISGSNISDLTGIEAFVNLKVLYCNNNQLSSINVTQNLGLRELYCNSCGLTSLNISQNLNLGYLDCNSNQISGLNVTQNQYLEYLSCGYNQLGTINVTQNPILKSLGCSNIGITSIDTTSNSNLEILYVGSNPLSNLNLTQNPNLKELYCNGCQLPSLNLTQNPNLNTIDFSVNQISTINLTNLINLKSISCTGLILSALDLSQNVNLEFLSCSSNYLVNLDLSQNVKLINLYCQNNQLQTINLKNGKIENSVMLFGNPSLTYICADEGQVSSLQSLAGSNTLVSPYCNFTPGGNYNIVSGFVSYDYNNDGCGVGDVIYLNSLPINLTNGTVSSGAFSSGNGSYLLYTTTGSHTLTASVANPSYFTITPNSVNINLPTLNNSTTTQNFCITPNGIHPDLEVVITPILPARPGFDAVYGIVYNNKGNQNLSGSVTFQYNDANLDFVSATTTPSSQSTGNLVWNYNNLMPFESRSINVTLNVNSPMETPAVNIGDVLNFTVTANPVSGDETTSDNTFQYNQTVVGAFDPNDKTCLEGNVVSPTQIGDYLHYNINFENTGTFQAENIVVKDVIDVTKFEINTLQVLDASHPVITRISGGKVEFIFENINLGANQKGNVVFKIKTKSNLVVGNSVSNKANIYFDYNFPIETNTATTTFQALSNSDFEIDNSVAVFPNPTKDKINVTATSNIKTIQVYDVQGRLLETALYDDTSVTVDLLRYNHGIYLLKIITENGVSFQKVIKE